MILGSTREGRFGEKAAAWAIDRLGARDDLVAELVDLRDYPMSFYEQERPPAHGDRDYPPEVSRWANKVDQADGYLVITPEYNHGYPAVLKNAFDVVFPEFNRKPIAFVGYGNSGGARSIEQLRLVSIELEMAPLRHAVHILPAVMVPARQAEEPSTSSCSPRLTIDSGWPQLIWPGGPTRLRWRVQLGPSPSCTVLIA